MSIKPLKYGTFSSGIEACSVAWEPLGWVPQFFSEIAPFQNALLAHYYPQVPNLGDMNNAHEKEEFISADVDLICAGTPCTSFSIAGLRAGMDSPNGNLALQYIRLLAQKQPRWFVWENVPGVFSSWSDEEDGSAVAGIGYQNGRTIQQTNDFDTLIAGFEAIGYGVAWRILDSEYFGIPQRRRRVFVVGYLGDWRRAAAVLFDSESLRRHPSAVPETGPVIAPLTASGIGTCGSDVKQAQAGHLIVDGRNMALSAVLPTLQSQRPGQYYSLNSLPMVMAHAHAHAEIWEDRVPTLQNRPESPIVFQQNLRDEVRYVNNNVIGALQAQPGMKQQSYLFFPPPTVFTTCLPTLTRQTHNQGPGVSAETAITLVNDRGCIRRLTPREVERAQGFPDDYTKIPYLGKPASRCADGPRYMAIGNSKAIPVVRWLGERIQMVDSI